MKRFGVSQAVGHVAKYASGLRIFVLHNRVAALEVSATFTELFGVAAVVPTGVDTTAATVFLIIRKSLCQRVDVHGVA